MSPDLPPDDDTSVDIVADALRLVHGGCAYAARQDNDPETRRAAQLAMPVLDEAFTLSAMHPVDSIRYAWALTGRPSNIDDQGLVAKEIAEMSVIEFTDQIVPHLRPFVDVLRRFDDRLQAPFAGNHPTGVWRTQIISTTLRSTYGGDLNPFTVTDLDDLNDLCGAVARLVRRSDADTPEEWLDEALDSMQLNRWRTGTGVAV